MNTNLDTSSKAWGDAGSVSAEVMLKASQAATTESESRYRQLVEGLPEAVYCCDRDGRVILFNDAAVKLWGRTPVLENAEYWCGSHRMFTLDGTYLPHDECPMAVALLQGVDFGSIEAVVERPGGERRYVLAHPKLIRNGDGDITGATNVVIDITERKLTEEALKAVDKNKDAFFAMLAHELRNPLAPISSASTLIQMLTDDQKVGRAATVVQRQVAHLSRLVEDLLDVSRMSQGAISLKKTRTSWEHVFDCALDVAGPLFEEKGQVLNRQFDFPSLELFCDSTRMAQILGNILVNAAKYSDRGTAIDIAATVEGTALTITVTDHGIGIAPGELAGIFDLYSQVSPLADRSRGGMGIGLSLVKNLVHLHDGTVAASSDGLGHGTRITIVLPIVLSILLPIVPAN